MDQWPEFVKEGEEAVARGIATGELTGWESVVFELAESQEEPDSSTAAFAP